MERSLTAEEYLNQEISSDFLQPLREADEDLGETRGRGAK